MDANRYTQIEQKIESFPALPAVVAQVLKVTNNPESSAADLMEAIQPDPSMCTAILKVANSALFGQPKKVSSLEQAITLLGFNEIESIVLGKAVVTSFQQILVGHKEELKEFWQHSFTCGLAAKIIAVHLNLSSGQFFMAGLIHDIGKLAMLLSFPKEYGSTGFLNQFSTQQQLQQETELFSISHELVGGKLLQKWNFPQNLLFSIGFHHQPERAPKQNGYPLVIQLADVLSMFCCKPDLLGEDDITTGVTKHLPDIQSKWEKYKLPFGEETLESWFAWLKIDHAHGSPILKLLSTR
ncbi:HDOD domain-containing protein [Desulfopila sp. IMCC35008]|uniref:HDOD domain-containing protein n=1 Tax=Desulfopila sp. IMCC35008 TaxID=2653858 RepID=UPI0013D62E8B|nr:HDOD domain-containing protein [Desulfopila sp. IMCC35008]